jgi:antitoxin component of RelBE/YafQ-DinJ toxin-antitoxin module
MNKLKTRQEKLNEETIAAIKEARSGKNQNKVYDSVDKLLKDLD